MEKIVMIDVFGALRRSVPRLRAPRKDSGATMAEHVFLFALIALVALAAVQLFGTAVRALFVVTFPGGF